MTSHQRQLIRQLIKKHSENSGTEFTIAFVAEQAGMLGACQAMLKDLDIENSASAEWLQFECSQNQVAYPSFLEDIRQVVALFRPSKTNEDYYEILGLTSDASLEDVKHAYRRLSLQYHPDTGSNKGENNSEQFIKINKAYRALQETESTKEDITFTPSKTHWNNKKKRHVTAQQKTLFLKWSIGLVAVLVVASIMASNNIKKRAMIAGLLESQNAFVPPAAKTVTEPEISQDEVDTHKQTIPVKTDFSESLKVKETTPEAIQQSQTESYPEVVSSSEFIIRPADMVKKYISHKKAEQQIKPAKITSSPSLEPEQQKPVESPKDILNPEQQSTTKPPDTVINESTIKNDATVALSAPLPPVQIKQIEEQQVHTQELENEQENIKADVNENRESVAIEQEPAQEKSKEQLIVQTEEAEKVSAELSQISEEEKIQNELQSTVELFLKQYIKAYEEQNLILFARFFEADAIENGESFKDGMSDYLDLFAKTSQVSLKVENTICNYLGEKIDVKGRFTVTLHFKNTHIVSGSGPIEFVLTNNDDNLLISEMTYAFE